MNDENQSFWDSISDSIQALFQTDEICGISFNIFHPDLVENDQYTSEFWETEEASYKAKQSNIIEKDIQLGHDSIARLSVVFEVPTSEQPEVIRVLFDAYFSALTARCDHLITKKSLNRRFSFYEKILYSIPSDLVVFDTDHRYQFINPIAVKDKEIREWLIGKDDFDYVEFRNRPKEIAEKRREVFNLVVKNRKKHEFEEKLITPNGDIEWKLRSMYPVFNGVDGELEMVIGYGLDITEIKEKNNEILSANTRLNTLISSLNSGVLLEDQDRRILVTNQVFCDIFEIPFSPEQLIGIDGTNSTEEVMNLFKEPEKFVSDINRLIKQGKPVVAEEIEFMDERIFERDFIPIYYQDVHLGNLWEYRDVTDKKKHEQKMIQALEAERGYNELNKNFVSMVSHEFRTPLTSIHSTSELLLGFMDRFTPEEQKERVQRIHNSSLKMEQLINDVLMIGKLDSSNSALQLSEFNFKEALVEVITTLNSTILKNRELDIRYKGIETTIKSDRNLVELVLRNLLENAGKYSDPDTPIAIDYSVTNNKISFTCTDKGIGIPEEDQKIIFESFKRASNTGQIVGTGLGLPIVKKSIQRLGGEVTLTSKVGEGTSITVTFSNQL